MSGLLSSTPDKRVFSSFFMVSAQWQCRRLPASAQWLFDTPDANSYASFNVGIWDSVRATKRGLEWYMIPKMYVSSSDGLDYGTIG
jgi:hypothetical protein